MKFALTTSLLSASVIIGGFAEEMDIEQKTTDFSFQQEQTEFNEIPRKKDYNWERYVSVNISGLTARVANFEVGNWKQSGKNSYVSALKQSISKNAYSISSSFFYHRHFNPFDQFTFYSGLGVDSGFFFTKEPTLLLITPALSLGKIISSSEDGKQFLELRTMLGHYYDYIGYPNSRGLAPSKFNYQIHYGVTF
jgi:hypothetical protein